MVPNSSYSSGWTPVASASNLCMIKAGPLFWSIFDNDKQIECIYIAEREREIES